MKSTESIDNFIKAHLKESRLRHTYGVRDTAVHLAKLYGADPEKAELAALYHDSYRWLKGDEMNACIKKRGSPGRYMDKPSLAHSKIAAIMIQRDFGEDDPDIINAVCYHTTGREDMSLLEKIVYLADAIEPNRDYPAVAELRELAEKDLDAACLASMKNTESYVLSTGAEMDSDTTAAIKYLETER